MNYRRRPIFLAPAMIVLYITLLILGTVYFLGVFFFQTHYLPNTTVGGVSCGFKTASYVEDINTSQISRYSVLVTDRKNNLFVIEGKEFNYQYVNLGEEKAIIEEQNPFLWPIALFKPNTYSLSYSVSYDEEQLEYLVTHLGLFKEDYIEKPENARIELEKDGYKIIPEVNGNSPIAEQVVSEIFDTVRANLDAVTLSDACYVVPEIHSSSSVLLDAASTLDSYLNAVITYNIWDTYEVVFGKEEIMSAIKLDKDFQITLDTSVFDNFVYQKLARPYNTYADKREFKTTNYGTIAIGGGDYGWVVDKKKESAEILKNITAGIPVTREPIWSQTARVGGLNDIGDTYIEVDYNKQILYYYEEGTLVLESLFVSGKPNLTDITKSNASPDGIYEVKYKDSDCFLTGADYRSHVNYFIVFAKNIGFHDATWRKSFGGTLFMTNGSHGCINMPLANAKTLYEKVKKGTPIVAYYHDNNIPTPQEYSFSYVKPPVTQ